METKIPFPLSWYIQRYLIMYLKFLTNLLYKYVAEPWQWHLAALHATEFLHRLLTWLGINDWHHKICSPATFLNQIGARWQSGQYTGFKASVFCTTAARETANEGPVIIQYKCLVPIYVFPEIKLLFPKQNYNVPSPSSYTLISVRDFYTSRIGLPILLQGNMWTDPVNI